MVWSYAKKMINAPLRKSDLIQVERTKSGRERPKIPLVEIVKKKMLIQDNREYESILDKMTDKNTCK